MINLFRQKIDVMAQRLMVGKDDEKGACMHVACSVCKLFFSTLITVKSVVMNVGRCSSNSHYNTIISDSIM